MPIDSKKQQLMIETYHKTSEQQKALLHLMALAYFPLEEDILKACLEKTSALFETEKDLFKNPKDINVRQLLHSLKNILVPSYSYSPYSDEIPSHLMHFLTLEALKSPHADQLMKALQEVSHAYFGKQGFETKGHLTTRFFTKYYTASDQLKHKELLDLRLALYRGEEKPFLALAQNLSSEELDHFLGTLFLEESLEIDWLKTRPIMAQHIIFHIKLFAFVLRGVLVEEVSSLLTHYLPLRDAKGYEGFNDTLLPYDILSGNFEEAEENLKQDGNPESFSFQALLGMLTFLKGQNEEAIALFDVAHKMMRKVLGRRNVIFGSHETLCYILALFKSDDKQHHKKIQTLLDLMKSDRSHEVSWALANILKKLQGHDDKIGNPFPHSYDKDMDPFTGAIVALADFWLEGDDRVRVNLTSAQRQFETYKNLLPLVAKIFAEILQRHGSKNQEVGAFLEKFKDLPSFLNCIHIQEAWQRKLATLDHVLTTLAPSSKSPKTLKKSKHLLWLFDPKTRELTPMEQGASKTAKGRPIALKRLFEAFSQLDYLTAEDKRVIQTLRKEKTGWNGQYVSYEWNSAKTPLALVGHPSVFHAQHPDLRIDLVAASPELIVKKTGRDQFHISLSLISSDQKVVIAQETPTLYRVIEFPKSWVPLAEILGSQGLKVPAAAKDHVLALLQKAGPVLPIQSEVGTLDIPSQVGDSTPCFHFTPLDQGLKVSLFVRPFEDKGPYFRPRQGNASLSLMLEGKPLRADRRLNEEKQRAEAVIKACSRLNLTQDGIDTWVFEDPQDCLEVLEELQNAQSLHPLKLEWPEGQKLTLTKPVSFDQLSLKIREKGEWFHLKGEIKIDENTVIDFQRLLQLLDQSPTRFIPLDNKTYISLTSHLKKQLQELKSFTEQTAEGAKIHGFGSFALKNLTDKVSQSEGDKGWKDKLKLFKEAENFQPVLPSTLQADLRDYQKEGFDWLSRLSALGLGACLADDMGLGKTLQALAVMLNHAPNGPCLVVAPTSVCHHWMSEIEKFAPTLKTYSLNQYA
ncbi:MAG: DEAD/DEAH box helicase, partial [Alphaproteobacteria bacterium]|nr:DEAD/DEAH box helicase [Alphaproteobacteria bacterium]